MGGSWICPKADIAAGNFDKITELCLAARASMLGFELAHVGVNCNDADESLNVCKSLNKAFGFAVKEGNSSNFAGTGFEIMKTKYLGANGHVAVRTNRIDMAIEELVMMTSKIQKGDTVFISGGAAVGLYIAIFARAWGASRVIVSEIYEPRRQFVESMGIETINPAQTDAMDLMREVTGGGGFDVVFDTSGASGPTLMMPDLCRCGNKMMSLNLSGDEYKFIIGKVSFKEQTLIGNRLYTQEEFELGTKFVADNWRELHLDRMVTDRLPLSEIEKALNMMLNGENICKIVINCEQH